MLLSTWGFWHRRRIESGAWSQSRSGTEYKLTFSGSCRTTEKQRLHVSKHHIATADLKGSNECRKAALRFVHTANMQRCATQQGQRSPKQQPPPWGRICFQGGLEPLRHPSMACYSHTPGMHHSLQWHRNSLNGNGAHASENLENLYSYHSH